MPDPVTPVNMVFNVVSPVPKKSTDSMSDYIDYFARLSAANSWDDNKQAVIFPSLLEIGSKALDGMSDTTLASFTLIKKALLGETEPFRESNLSQLHNLSYKNGNETLRSYREKIAGLVEKIYPKFAASNKQSLIRDFFVHSLPDDYQKFIMSTNSTKIEEALNAAIMFESMAKRYDHSKSDSFRPKTKFRKDDRDVQERSRSDHYGKNFKPKSKDECHFCHLTGHYAKDCTKKKKYYDQKERSGQSQEKKSIDGVNAKCYLTLQLGGNIEDMMVDTGAEISIVPASRFSPDIAVKTPLTVADGNILDTFGYITLPVRTLDGRKIADHKFCVAAVNKCYLGYDILKNTSAEISLTNDTISLKNIKMKMHKGEKGNSNNVFSVLADIGFVDDVHFLTEGTPEVIDENDKNFPEKPDVENLLNNYEGMFEGIGKTDLVQHYIPLVDNVPVNATPYRLPVHLKEKASKIIDEYLENDIIRPSKSEYCSPVVLVKKSNSDDVRVTIDFRALNAKCKKDQFSSPRIDDVIENLEGAVIFSKLDIKCAYHNIEVADEDKHKTAFRFNGKL